MRHAELTTTADTPRPDTTDYWIALAIGACGLAAYVRTLAPDLLYGDSAEFQALAYTLGTTHSTGYPIYLLLARLLGFLPVGSLAWRVSLLSAVGAAMSLSAVYLIARYLTRGRIGAVLASVALGLSYTFWSQAIIAEVYTPALAFLSAILLLLWRWHDAPAERSRALLLAALLSGLGLGVHAFVVLIAPTAVFFVILTLWSQRLPWLRWRRAFLAALAGVAVGVGVFLPVSLLIDLNDPPSSFVRVALYPSRSAWGLEVTDLDSPFERLWLTMTGRQWQDAMFPDNVDMLDEILAYIDRLLSHEFSALMFLCAVLGVTVLVRTRPRLGACWLVAFATTLYFILSYQPPDKYIFFLPTYVLVAVAIGGGVDSVLDWGRRHLLAARKRRYLAPLYVLVVALLVAIVVWPSGSLRWQALRDGAATFVQEDYVYPLEDLEAPRLLAAWKVRSLPEDAVVISDWRTLYAMLYLAHVERLRPDIIILEASPHGADGLVAESLVQMLKDVLREGRPVFTTQLYSNLRAHFRVQPALGGEWYRLSLPGGS